MLSMAMAALWLGGILLYGIGAGLKVGMGTSAGFVLMVASVVIAANVAGIPFGGMDICIPQDKKGYLPVGWCRFYFRSWL